MTDQTKGFVQYLTKLAAKEAPKDASQDAAKDTPDRAALATLRRGLSGEPRDLARVYPIVLPRAPEDQQDAYMKTACLFGLHPTEARQLDGADTVAGAMRKVLEKTKSSSIEARFVALLGSHRDELFEHLRYCVSLAKSHSIALRWDDVLDALRWWTSNPTSRNSIRQRWARDFWGSTVSSKPSETPENSPTVTADANE